MANVLMWPLCNKYCETSNIIRTSVDNTIIDHSDEVGALPVSAASTTYSSSSNTWLQSIW